MKRGACGCTNHLGRPKVKYPTREAAVHAILTRHLPRSGGMAHSTYPCPNMPDVWHVRSERRKAS